MAEYIVDFMLPERRAEKHAAECANVHERIVRCMDCKHSTTDCLQTGFLGCQHFAYDNGVVYRAYPVNPDGFCAWGKRRLVE